MFSGIVKLNDPSGFGIKLNEYFDVFAQDLATPQDSMRLVVYSQGQKLIDQKTVLYSFDTEKEMVVEVQGVSEGVKRVTLPIGKSMCAAVGVGHRLQRLLWM